jgi:ABC-type amino acid transport substrate-binding protein
MGASIGKFLAPLAAVATLSAINLTPATAGMLDKLRDGKTIHLGVRDDAPPFSYKDDKGQPAGFMVDLCRAVAHHISGELKVGELAIEYVPVTASDRFEAIETGKADLLCEATSATLSRREHVDFSIATFLDGASLIAGGVELTSLKDLTGKKVGVLAGTTTEASLKETLRLAGIAADIVPAKTHEEGIAMLDKGDIAAYFGDRAILAFVAARSSAPDKLHLAQNYFSAEPYALALPRGDSDFRLAVDRALSRIYRSGQIAPIFAGTFGSQAPPSDTLKTLFAVAALPE